MVLDDKGNLFGTTRGGGAHEWGTVFKVTPSGKETVLYSFCDQNSCPDGDWPVAGLILDAKGNLYGTTRFGGAYGYGTVFKLTPGGRETILHSFCAEDDCIDGEEPEGGLIFDSEGNLYGTTATGGAGECNFYICGVVFKITP